MSQETQEWLENNILVGYTDRRGNAWWDRGAMRADGTPNHYEGPIPIMDVEQKLFDWEPIELPVFTGVPIANEDGIGYAHVLDEKRKAIAPNDDPTHTFGIFSTDYQPHGPKEWLITNVADLIGAENDLNISSAGQLKGRAIPFVEISVPDTFHTPEGIDFRANLLATTSFDGSVATTYKRTATLTVCDNTWRAAMGEKGQQFKRRHTARSNDKAVQDEARQALNLLYGSMESIAAELTRLCEWTISDVQFKEVLRLSTLDPKTGKAPEGKRGVTVSERKLEEIEALYRHDPRVAPWAGTAFGTVQAFNTWNHHTRATYKGTDRAERNMLNTIKGDHDKWDAEVLAMLEQAYATV